MIYFILTVIKLNKIKINLKVEKLLACIKEIITNFFLFEMEKETNLKKCLTEKIKGKNVYKIHKSSRQSNQDIYENKNNYENEEG